MMILVRGAQSCVIGFISFRPSFEELVEMWPYLTTQVLCPDPNGREVVARLWCKVGCSLIRNTYDCKGKEEEGVAFDEFKTVFEKICLVDDIVQAHKKTFRSIRAMLSLLLCETQFEDIVTKQRFCNFVSWFGPIDKETNCRGFFTRIKDLLSMKCVVYIPHHLTTQVLSWFFEL